MKFFTIAAAIALLSLTISATTPPAQTCVCQDNTPAIPTPEIPTECVAAKRIWFSNGEHHETDEVTDAEGCVHQIHRWVDRSGRKHETDCWNTHADEYIQIHRFQERDGCVHELRQIVDAESKVQEAHFKKDIYGRVVVVDDVRQNLCVEAPSTLPDVVPPSEYTPSAIGSSCSQGQ